MVVLRAPLESTRHPLPPVRRVSPAVQIRVQRVCLQAIRLPVQPRMQRQIVCVLQDTLVTQLLRTVLFVQRVVILALPVIATRVLDAVRAITEQPPVLQIILIVIRVLRATMLPRVV
jgi:hypothetical protein